MKEHPLWTAIKRLKRAKQQNSDTSTLNRLEANVSFQASITNALFESARTSPDRIVRAALAPEGKPCCDDEHRTMDGGCTNCGDPCL